MRTSAALGAMFYLLGLGALFAVPSFYEVARDHVERSWPVYAPVRAVHHERVDGGMVIRAIGWKLQPACAVVAGSDIFLSVSISESGPRAPRLFPAIKPGVGLLKGAPLVPSRREFLVGPWLVQAPDAVLDRVSDVSVMLHCRFPSGVERLAEIGPMHVSRQ